MATESPVQPTPDPALSNGHAAEQGPPFDVMRCRNRFAPLRDAFQVEQESHDYLSLQRVTADVVKPLLYGGSAAKLDLDCVLRNLGAEFMPDLVAWVATTPAYYPTGEKAWVEEYPSIEPRETMDNRFCAFYIIAIFVDTVPALASRLAKDSAFQLGALRLMFNMYIRAMNPLKVEDDAEHHPHISSSSEEPKIWIPQWRTIISCLVLLAAGYDGVSSLKQSWNQIVSETRVGAEKVKVKESVISEVLLQQASKLQEREKTAADADSDPDAEQGGSLDNEERRTLVEFSRFAVLMSAPDGSSAPPAVDYVLQELATRDRHLACGGCGKKQPSERDLIKCEGCQVLVYCSQACRELDWERYHEETCRYPLS